MAEYDFLITDRLKLELQVREQFRNTDPRIQPLTFLKAIKQAE